MKDLLKEKILAVLKEKELVCPNDFTIDIPDDNSLGDYSTNVALKNAKLNSKNPMELAEIIKENLKIENVTKIEIKAPGFINFFVDKNYLLDNINKVLKEKENYGRINIGNKAKVNIEFVSANPTGILHIGNARGGAYGDNLSRIMDFAGFDVTKEYYINDAGNQVNALGKSLQCRYFEVCGLTGEMPENGYHGNDIKDLANKLYQEHNNKLVDTFEEFFKDYAVKSLIGKIFDDLKEYRITYDKYTSEKEIRAGSYINDILTTFKENSLSYELDGATWFKGTSYDAPRDFVLVKNDDAYTYVLPDIAHYMDNYKRDYIKMINVLGTDHHGYVPVIKSALKALKYDTSKVDIKLLQLVRLIKDGTEFKMSKRSGTSYTLKELIDEVGVNAARYFFAARSLDTQMDFNIDIATKENNENPVFYICYAYARICSVLANYPDEVEVEKYTTISSNEAYNVLVNIYSFSEIVKDAALKELPHLIANYCYELANSFHIYYSKHRIISENEVETRENINMIKAVKITLANALNLIGVIPPEKM